MRAQARRMAAQTQEDGEWENGRRGGTKEVANAVPSAADATTNVVKLPVRFVKGLRRKVRDREPPADCEHFWARIRHRGITRIACGE